MHRPSPKASAIVAALGVAGVASIAVGGPRDVLLCVTGFPGTTEQARPTVQGFLNALSAKLGWPAGAVTGDYYPDPDVGLREIRARRPGFAAMSLDLFLAHGRDLGAEVLARTVMRGRDRQRYHVVVAKEGGAAEVDALTGVVLAPFRESARFLGNLVLDGKRPLAESLDLRYEANAMSALRKVARGQAAAAVVEEEIIERFTEVPVHDYLRVLAVGPWLPGPPFVALPGSTEPDRAAIRQALPVLCSGDGAETCRSMRVDAFRSASASDYAEAKRLFDR